MGSCWLYPGCNDFEPWVFSDGSMDATVSHPALVEGVIEARAYQLEAVDACLGASTLLVLPTALGKTPIEWMVIAERLRQHGGRALMIAPTNALLNQHLENLREVLVLDDGPESVVALNGSIDWKRRQRLWDAATVVVATPQVIRNDVQRGSIDLTDVCLLVADEAHHAIGKDAAGEVGELYRQQAANALVLGATASPGSTDEQVTEVCQRLGLSRIHVRRAEDALLEPYAAGLRVQDVPVEVPEELRLLAAPLQRWLDTLVDQLRRLGYYVHAGRVTMSALADARGRIQVAINRREGLAYNAARQNATAHRLLNLIGYLLCQGVAASRESLQRMEHATGAEQKSAAAFLGDARIRDLRQTLAETPELHRKVDHTQELVLEQLRQDPDSRVIVFAHFRDTVNEIVSRLNRCEGVIAERFVGQTSRAGSRGMSQRKQIEGLHRFRDGECNVLVATSVGEEGLDVPRADRVIFYEPVGSEIRTIQRRGRTGRHRSGQVFVLIATGTRDEGARASALARERRMHEVLDRVRRSRGTPTGKQDGELLQAFTIKSDDGEQAPWEFVEAERERLAPELGTQRERIERIVGKPDEEEDEQEDPAQDEVDPQRLRPRGQRGLDFYPSDAASERMLGGGEEADAEPIPVNLEGLALRAAEDIVQALTTDAVDPLENATDIPCRIVVDHRELNTTIAASLRLQGIDVDVQTLAVGDFQIGDRVLIERKRVRDFVDSLLDGRLLEQAHRLVAAAPRPLLLIEGGDLFMQRAVHMNALMGALATLTVDLGLPVVTTADGEETARFLAIAARREQALLGALTKAARQRLGAAEGGDESLGRFVERQQPGEPGAEVAREERAGAAAQTVISVEASEVSDTGWEGQKVILDASGAEGALATRERKELRFDRLAMLQSVPGVGPATADRLLARFESVAGVAAATVEELATVSGIGAAKAARILEVLNN